MGSGNIKDEVKEVLSLFGAFDYLKKLVDLEHLNKIILKAVT
jgi:hypothetical protein